MSETVKYISMTTSIILFYSIGYINSNLAMEVQWVEPLCVYIIYAIYTVCDSPYKSLLWIMRWHLTHSHTKRWPNHLCVLVARKYIDGPTGETGWVLKLQVCFLQKIHSQANVLLQYLGMKPDSLFFFNAKGTLNNRRLPLQPGKQSYMYNVLFDWSA